MLSLKVAHVNELAVHVCTLPQNPVLHKDGFKAVASNDAVPEPGEGSHGFRVPFSHSGHSVRHLGLVFSIRKC